MGWGGGGGRVDVRVKGGMYEDQSMTLLDPKTATLLLSEGGGGGGGYDERD